MKFVFSETAKWYVLTASLMAVLALLAALQYESSKQISQATTEQMLGNLEGGLINLRYGLESELMPLCRDLQAGDLQKSDSRRNDAPSNGAGMAGYTAQVEHWRREAENPGMVKEVYIWQSGNSSSSGFFRLDVQTKEVRPSEWPANFVDLRQRLEEVTPKEDPATNPRGHNGSIGHELGSPSAHDLNRDQSLPEDENETSASNKLFSPDGAGSPDWMIDESIPVLVHRAHQIVETAGGRKLTNTTWIMAVLDLEVLSHQIMPELVQRYFGYQNQSSYETAMVREDGDSRSVIYSSDPTFPGRSDVRADASLNLFGPPHPALRKDAVPGSSAVSVQMPPQVLHSAYLGRNTAGTGPEEEPFRIDPIYFRSQGRGWELVARHRQGSVVAAVTSLYHRNLAFNFCVLLVLAATMGMIGFNSRRAHRLARLQMDFVASVSHELRTPLTGIVSAAQNMADGIVDEKEKVTRYGAAILNQAHQLTGLVEQILLFSATEKDGHRYHFQLASVEKLIDSSLANLSSLIRSSGVTVECQVQAKLPGVMVDTSAFSHCLQNLIVNAIKYGGERRWLKITASSEHAGGPGEEIVIAIQDHGIGIEARDLKSIFEPFYRTPVATAAQIHGTGLGLPLAKSITEAMGGRLTVVSAPQQGSTFTIHLPVANPMAVVDPV